MMETTNEKVLIVDDEAESLDICQRILSRRYPVRTAGKPAQAFDILQSEEIDCLLTDLVMPNVKDLEFVEEVHRRYPDLPILVMSGKATLKMAVQAMKAGAFDFIEKPILDLEILPVMVSRALASHGLVRENRRLREQLSSLERRHFIGRSREIQRVLEIVRKVAPLNSTVLIEGQTGTGKEMIAHMIHDNSPRSSKRFVAVNCGAVPENLLESLLFGHVKGAFTGAIKEQRGYFEEADGGTLFLDEIGETPLPFQVKLLRALQEKLIRPVGAERDQSVDVRILAATNRSLESEVQQERFRKDLYYRLNVIRIQVPSLSERHDDIPLLARHFLEAFMRENGLAGSEITRDAQDALMAAKWEGNIRELQNVIEYAGALCQDRKITVADLPEYLRKNTSPEVCLNTGDDYENARHRFDTIFFRRLLDETGGKVSEMARISGLARQNVYQKLKQLGLERKKDGEGDTE
jgi:DNA-binding NtrC family response regulator